MMNMIKTFLPALLLSLCLAMPVPASAGGNKHTGTVLRTPEAKGKTIIIAPPKTSAHADLKPYEKPVNFMNGWFCREKSLTDIRKRAETGFMLVKTGELTGSLALRDMAKRFLKNEKKESPPFFGISFSPDFKADPPQGGTASHTWDNCYSLEELDTYKREAIRWAHYILDVYLPGLKNKK